MALQMAALAHESSCAVAWNLRRIRVKRGVSQERLAYDAGVDRAYVGGLERQTENPTIDLVDRLAVTLAVPLFELFVFPPKGASAPKPLPKDRKVSLPPRKI
jgi:transcriptional regulator with XRE-family HTH domain